MKMKYHKEKEGDIIPNILQAGFVMNYNAGRHFTAENSTGFATEKLRRECFFNFYIRYFFIFAVAVKRRKNFI